MKGYKYNQKHYTGDWQSKLDATASTITIMPKSAKVSFYGVDNSGNLVPLSASSINSTIDIVMIVEWRDNTYRYVLECKERGLDSEAYGNEGQEGWIIEEGKRDELLDWGKKGYIPIFFNLYTDGWVRVWNLNDIDIDDYGHIVKRTKDVPSAENSGYTTKPRLYLMNKQGKKFKRIKGNDQEIYN